MELEKERLLHGARSLAGFLFRGAEINCGRVLQDEDHLASTMWTLHLLVPLRDLQKDN